MSKISLPRVGEKKEISVRTKFTQDTYELLSLYAEAYEATYGEKIAPATLVPIICGEFLRKDHGFKKYQVEKNSAKRKNENTNVKLIAEKVAG